MARATYYLSGLSKSTTTSSTATTGSTATVELRAYLPKLLLLRGKKKTTFPYVKLPTWGLSELCVSAL